MSTRSLYRSLLRELPPRVSPRAPRSSLHNRLRDAFAEGKQNPALAEQLAVYLRSQRMYGVLLDRYNPGMNMDEEERVRLSARRVGMEMPQVVER